tara:strand:- start:352773 stop:353501 length:729 start_codon:yes stop_codon:yes gene_type:complete
VESYRTEDEQVEALRRWWDENGRSIIAAIIIALSAGFGWQAWQGYTERQQSSASDLYQAMIQTVDAAALSAADKQRGIELAQQLKANYEGTTYAQFAALHLARLAVADNKLPEAEEQLRWVLSKADAGSDIAQVAQLRLGRVLASSGDVEQALRLLQEPPADTYASAYAVAAGDALLAAGRDSEALDTYNRALMLAAANSAQINLPSLQEKIQSLNPVLPHGAASTAQSGDAKPDADTQLQE